MGYYDTDYLEHHGILGQKHGQRNGPPYPLGMGDHSSAEKSAASTAGVKVGKSSGKGSIENVKKSKKGGSGSGQTVKKAPLTEEEKRLKAEEARLKGDSKGIKKYMDKLTTQELQDAQTRANIKKSLSDEKVSKAEKDKKEAMLSGDKEKVKEYATKMTTQELQDAMNKVDLMARLNYTPPAPTTMDKINSAMKKIDTARDWMDKGLRAYDALAAINNTFNKDHQWPRAEFGGKKDDKKKDGSPLESMAKKITADAQNAKAQNDQRQNQKNIDRRLDQNDKALEFEKKKYEDQQKQTRAEKKEEAREAKRESRAEKKAEREAKKAEREEKTEERQTKDDTAPTEIKKTYDTVKDKPMSSYKDDDYYDDYIDSVMTKYERSSGKQETLSDYYDDIQSNYRESTRRREESIKDQQETARAAREAKLQLRDATHEMATANTDAQRQKALDRLDYWQTVLTNNDY